MRQRTLDHGSGRECESENARQSGGGDHTATQSASNGLAERAIRTVGEQLRTLQHDTQNRHKTRNTLDSAIWPCMVRCAGFCVTRYARGAGGITPFRAAYDREYTQEIVPFQKLSCSRSSHQNIVDFRRERDSIRRTQRGTRTVRTLEPTKRSETSLLLKIQGSTLGLGTERTATWETQETPATSTSLTTSSRIPDRRQVKQFKRQFFLVVIISTSSEWNSATRD